MSKKNGIIIPLAWPDDLVASNMLKYDGILSWFRICKNGFYKVGHAAMLLINADSGEVCYYDFGRYIAEPRRFGRIRSKKTDPEVHFDIKADVDNGKIRNWYEILRYTNAHPQTHGKGTMYAGISPGYDFEKVYRHIEEKQSQGLIKYGAFTVGGTNCSRFVAQTMARFSNIFDKIKLLYPWYGTPSPLGNIFKSYDRKMYVVEGSDISVEDVSRFSKQFKVLKDKILFDEDDPTPHIKESRKGAFVPKEKPGFLTENAQWIGGVGAGAWHELLEISASSVRFRRTQDNGHIDVDDHFYSSVKGKQLTKDQKYTFIPGTTCARLMIEQGQERFEYLPAKKRQLSVVYGKRSEKVAL